MKKLFLYMGILILVACNFLFAQPAPIRTMFLWQLLDTPNTYTGQADKILQINAGATAIEFTSLSDFITLGTHTTGNYVATITDAGNSVITVTGSGSESATITLDITNSGIVEADLKVVDSATDEDIFTYESTTGDFEWHTIVQMLALTDTDSLSEGSTNLYQDSEVTGWIDDVTLGSSGALTIPTGQAFVVGTTTWTSSDELDGTKIKDADYGDIAVSAGGAWTLDGDAVDESHIADNGIDSEHYNDGSIDLVHLAAGVYAKDLVTTSPITGAANNIFVGADSDVTIALTLLKDIVTTAPITGGANDVLPGADADLTLAITLLKDVVATSPVLIDGGTNVDDILPGADADLTISVTVAKDIVTTAPITGAVDNVIIGTDADITLGIDVLKDLVTTAPVTGGTNDIFTGADADITVALDFTASWDFGGAAGFELPNAAAPTTNATGEIALDTTITDHQPLWQYYDGGENMTLIAIDTAQLPAQDNEIVKYDAGSDKFVLEVDASAGTTAWDDIADPDNSGLTTITFDNAELSLFTGDNDAAASFITIQNSDADHTGGNLYLLDLDYSGDEGDVDADFIKLQDSGSVLMTIQEEGKIVMTPGGAGSIDIINITPSAVIATNEAIWNGLKIVGAALDPSGDDVLICGVVVDLSGVVPTGSGEDTDGIQVKMTDGEEHAIHIEEGKVVIDNTSGSAAGAEYTVVDIRLDTSSLNANSDIHAIDVAVEAGTPSGTVVALGTHSNVTPIRQSIGSFSTPNQNTFAGKYVTNDWIDGDDGGVPEDLNGNEIFESNADWIAVGSAAVFSEIEVSFIAPGTPGTKTVFPTFWYSTEANPDNWVEFFPADDTDGFQQSGTIRWLLADISGSWTGDGAPGGAEATAGYWIKIVRTANANPGSPTPTTIKTGTIINYFWDKTGAVDLLSMEADTITEGGSAVFSAGNAATWTSLHTFASSSGIALDDGVGDSPTFTIKDGDNKTLTIIKDDDGEAKIANNEGAIHIITSNDFDDYLTITTTGDVPIINAVGSTLTITADNGSISFGDENLTTTGTFKAGLLYLSTTAGITASTTQNQGQGALTTNINEVSTCANGNDVVTLPTAVAGLIAYVFNNGAQTLQVFPASGDDLGAGADTSETVAATKNVMYIAYDATNWEKTALN